MVVINEKIPAIPKLKPKIKRKAEKFVKASFYCYGYNPEETSPEVQNRGISGPKNGHVPMKIKKKTDMIS